MLMTPLLNYSGVGCNQYSKTNNVTLSLLVKHGTCHFLTEAVLCAIQYQDLATGVCVLASVVIASGLCSRYSIIRC